MGMYLGDFKFGSTVFFGFTTVSASGAPTAFSSGAVTVYRNESTVQDTTGITLTSSHDTLTGFNHVQIDMSTAGFYSSAGSYIAIVSSGAASEDLTGYVLANWSLRSRFAGLESSAGLETLSSVGLETLSSAGLETLSSAGLETLSSAGLETLSSAGLETISSAVVVAAASSALEGANLDHLLSAEGSSDHVTDGSLWSALVSTTTSYVDYDSSTDSLAGIRAAIAASSDVNVVEWAGSTVLGVAGGPSTVGLETLSSAGLETLSSAGLETISSAVVKAVASSAIELARLDHLLQSVGSSDDVTDGSLWSALVSTTTSYVDYDSSTDSLAGIRAAIAASSDVNVVEWAGSTVLGVAGGPSTVGLETLSSAGLETLSSAGLETLSSAVAKAVASSAIELARLDHLLQSAGSSDDVTDGSLWSALVSTTTSYVDYDSSTDSLAGIRAAIAASSDVNVVEWAGSTVLGVAGGPSTVGLETLSSAGLETLSSAGLETLSSAVVKAVATSAIELAELDHLLQSVGSSDNVTDGSLWSALVSTTTSYVDFDSSTDSLAGIRAAIAASSDVNVVEWAGSTVLGVAGGPSTVGLETLSSAGLETLSSAGLETLSSAVAKAVASSAIELARLDHLLQVVGSSDDVTDGSLWSALVSTTTSYVDFDSSTDSLAGIRAAIAASSDVNVVEWGGSTVLGTAGGPSTLGLETLSSAGLETLSSAGLETLSSAVAKAVASSAIELARLDHLLQSVGSSDDVTDGSLWSALVSTTTSYVDYDSSTDSLAGIRAAVTAAGVASSEVNVIEWAGSTVLGTAGGPSTLGLETLSSAGLETLSSAVAKAVASSAIELAQLDHLLQSVGSSDDVTDGSLWAALVSSSTSYVDYNSSTQSLSALRTRGDAAWATLSTAGLETLSSAGLETASSHVNVREWAGSTVEGVAGGPSTAGLETLSSAGLETLSSAGLETASSFVQLSTANAYGEPAAGAPAASESLVDKIGYMYSALRTGLRVSASGKTFLNDAGAVLWVKGLVDDGTTYVEIDGTTST